jgi:hypothetical protein
MPHSFGMAIMPHAKYFGMCSTLFQVDNCRTDSEVGTGYYEVQ